MSSVVKGAGDPALGEILLVEDDEQLRGLLALVLRHEGYGVAQAGNAREALLRLRDDPPDLLVLDVLLGEDDGRTLLSELRQRSDLPVILVSGQGDISDRVLGLRLGADDFLSKPFAPVELVARVETVLRRARRPVAAVTPEPLEGLRLDELAREVFVDGAKVELTAREFDLVAFLARSPRQVFSRAQLLEHVWRSHADWQDEATVTEHIRRIRVKLELDPQKPRWIKTVRGVGYRFEP